MARARAARSAALALAISGRSFQYVLHAVIDIRVHAVGDLRQSGALGRAGGRHTVTGKCQTKAEAIEALDRLSDPAQTAG